MECEHVNIETDDGERTCHDCGAILGCCIDEGAEWRIYANTDEDPSRTGTITSELLPNSSYGSVMMRKFNQSEEAKTIAKLSAWSFSSHGERSWMGIFDAIQTTALRAALPKAIIMDACALFKLVETAQKTRGETRRALMAGAVFTACRQHNATRSHEEIASLFHVSIRSLCKALSHFENDSSSVLNTQLGLAERMCADLGLNDRDRDQVVLMLQKLPELEHTPKTIVAGVLSIVLGGQLAKVSASSGVSTVSIRKITEKLKQLESKSQTIETGRLTLQSS
jgi:transcription initiation factor TFIIIB Brf1 subunit/transcription initiation factor TFIIB